MSVVMALLFGGIVGWIASLVLRTPTQEGILIDIVAGITGAVAGLVLWGRNSTLDAVVAAYLGAMLFSVALHFGRGMLTGKRMREPASTAQDEQAKDVASFPAVMGREQTVPHLHTRSSTDLEAPASSPADQLYDRKQDDRAKQRVQNRSYT